MRESQLNSRETYTLSLMEQVPNEWLPLFEESKKNAIKIDKNFMSISASEGKILSTVIALAGCKSFIEIGTLTGYSALWILLGMGENCNLITLEKEPTHAELANSIFKNLPANYKTEIKLGDAREEIQKLSGTYDGVFIDGNKAAYGDYLAWAEIHVKKNGLIISDNIYLNGTVYESKNGHNFNEKQIRVMQEHNLRLSDPKFYRSCIVPTGEGLFVAQKLF